MTIRNAASILLSVAAILSPAAADACRCVSGTPAVSYRQAAAVMLGTVTDARDPSADERAFTVTVERSWKRPPKGMVTIHSTRSDCPADVQPGERHLIYVLRDTRGLWRTSSCRGDRRAADSGPALAWLAHRR